MIGDGAIGMAPMVTFLFLILDSLIVEIQIDADELPRLQEMISIGEIRMWRFKGGRREVL